MGINKIYGGRAIRIAIEITSYTFDFIADWNRSSRLFDNISRKFRRFFRLFIRELYSSSILCSSTTFEVKKSGLNLVEAVLALPMFYIRHHDGK